MNLLNGTGLDGRSVLIGAGLVLAGMVASHSGPVVPLLIIGGIAWAVGAKKGWWGDNSRRAARSAAPAPSMEWQHAAWQAGWRPGPAAPTPPAPPAPPAAPRDEDREIRIPVTDTGTYRRTAGGASETIV